MATDIGNRGSPGAMRLQCGLCEPPWIPPDWNAMANVRLHMQRIHGRDDISMELVPTCTCGSLMQVTVSRPTGGGFKDYLFCMSPTCGNTGYIRRQPREGE